MADAPAVVKGKKKGGLANLLKKRKSKKKAASLDDLNATAPSSSHGPTVASPSEVMVVDRTLTAVSPEDGESGSPGAQARVSSGATVTVGIVASKSDVGAFEPDLDSLDAGRTIRSAVRKHQTRLAEADVAEAPKPAVTRRYVAGGGRATAQWGKKHETPTLSEALGGGKASGRSGSGVPTQPNMWTQLAMADGESEIDDSRLGASAAVEVLGDGMPAIQLTSTLCTGPVLTRPELLEAASMLAKDLRDDLKPAQRADEAVALKPIDGPEHRVQVAVAVLVNIGEWNSSSRAAVGPFLEHCLRKRAFTPGALCVALAEEVYPALPDLVCDAPRLYEYVASALEPLVTYRVLDVSSPSSPDVACMPPGLRKAMKLQDADFEAKAAAEAEAEAAAKAEAEAAALAAKEAKEAAAKAAEQAEAAASARAAAEEEAAKAAKAAAEARSARVFVPSAARRSAGDTAAPTYSAAPAPAPAADADADVAALLAASSGKKKKSKKSKKTADDEAAPPSAAPATPAPVAVASDAAVTELLLAAAGGKKKKKSKKSKKAASE